MTSVLGLILVLNVINLNIWHQSIYSYTVTMASSRPTTDILRDCIQFCNRYYMELYSEGTSVHYNMTLFKLHSELISAKPFSFIIWLLYWKFKMYMNHMVITWLVILGHVHSCETSKAHRNQYVCQTNPSLYGLDNGW